MVIAGTDNPMIPRPEERAAIVRVRDLCDRAIGGGVDVREFHNQWPEELNLVALFREIFDDLENAVEHFPADLLTGAPAVDYWVKSEEVLTLTVDRVALDLLLAASVTPERLQLCRERTLKTRGITRDDVLRVFQQLLAASE